jgi:hypothetical protein
MLNAPHVLYLIKHLKETILSIKTFKFHTLGPYDFQVWWTSLFFVLYIIFYNVIQQFLIENKHFF